MKSDLFMNNNDSLEDRLNQNRNQRLKGNLERHGF